MCDCTDVVIREIILKHLYDFLIRNNYLIGAGTEYRAKYMGTGATASTSCGAKNFTVSIDTWNIYDYPAGNQLGVIYYCTGGGNAPPVNYACDGEFGGDSTCICVCVVQNAMPLLDVCYIGCSFLPPDQLPLSLIGQGVIAGSDGWGNWFGFDSTSDWKPSDIPPETGNYDFDTEIAVDCVIDNLPNPLIVGYPWEVLDGYQQAFCCQLAPVFVYDKNYVEYTIGDDPESLIVIGFTLCLHFPVIPGVRYLYQGEELLSRCYCRSYAFVYSVVDYTVQEENWQSTIHNFETQANLIASNRIQMLINGYGMNIITQNNEPPTEKLIADISVTDNKSNNTIEVIINEDGYWDTT